MNIAQSLENLRLEGAIAPNERRHADSWANRLREPGATVAPPARPRSSTGWPSPRASWARARSRTS